MWELDHHGQDLSRRAGRNVSGICGLGSVHMANTFVLFGVGLSAIIPAFKAASLPCECSGSICGVNRRIEE